MKTDLADLIGYKMMVGVEGPKPTSAMIKRFQRIKPGGIILFRPNFDTPGSLRDLIKELEAAAGHRLITAVDHEGGRVIHIPHGITVFPDNLMLGTLNKEALARKQGEIEGAELRKLGIDLNLAPTLDVLADSFSPNIGIRSYGKDPHMVAKLGIARLEGMKSKGLATCAKHFPGLGPAPVDPHLDLPVLSSGWEEMNGIHLIPFKAAIKAGVEAVMTSHPVYPQLDDEKLPVTFSKKLVREFLRKELGYTGLILSDDLEMGALRNFGSIEDCAVRAIEAGHDLVLICHDTDAQVRTWERLLKVYDQGKLSYEELTQSVERVKQFSEKRKARYEGDIPAGGNALAQEIAREAVLAQKKLSLKKETPVLVIFPELSLLAAKIYIEKEMMDEKNFITEKFIRKGFPKPEVLTVGLTLSPDQIQRCVQAARQFKQVLFFCYDAHLDPGTRELLAVLQKNDSKLTVVFLRDPYDVEYLKPGQPFLQAYGFRSAQVGAVLEGLL